MKILGISRERYINNKTQYFPHFKRQIQGLCRPSTAQTAQFKTQIKVYYCNTKTEQCSLFPYIKLYKIQKLSVFKDFKGSCFVSFLFLFSFQGFPEPVTNMVMCSLLKYLATIQQVSTVNILKFLNKECVSKVSSTIHTRSYHQYTNNLCALFIFKI